MKEMKYVDGLIAQLGYVLSKPKMEEEEVWTKKNSLRKIYWKWSVFVSPTTASAGDDVQMLKTKVRDFH